MAIDKLNPFNKALARPAIEPIKAVGKQPDSETSGSSKSGSNPFFGGNTVGVNTNIGVGSTTNIPAQAGKKAGLGRTLGFA